MLSCFVRSSNLKCDKYASYVYILNNLIIITPTVHTCSMDTTFERELRISDLAGANVHRHFVHQRSGYEFSRWQLWKEKKSNWNSIILNRILIYLIIFQIIMIALVSCGFILIWQFGQFALLTQLLSLYLLVILNFLPLETFKSILKGLMVIMLININYDN